MNKIIKSYLYIIFFLALMIAVILPSQAYGYWYEDESIDVIVNSETMQLDNTPIMYDNRVMLPMRNVFENLNANVYYYSGCIFACTKNQYLSFTLPDYLDNPNSTEIVYGKIDQDEKDIKVSPQPFEKEGTTYIPIRTIAEVLGCNVQWINGNVVISNVDTTPPNNKTSDIKVLGEKNGILVMTADKTKLDLRTLFGLFYSTNLFPHSGWYADYGDNEFMLIDTSTGKIGLLTIKSSTKDKYLIALSKA